MGDNQNIVIDLAGQVVDVITQRKIKNSIVEKSNGIIKLENIEFED